MLLRPWGFSRQECWSGLPCPSLTTDKQRAKYHTYFCLYFPHCLQKMLVGVEGGCVIVQFLDKPFLSIPATKPWGWAGRLSLCIPYSTALLPDALMLLLSRFPNPLIILHFGWFLSQLPSFAFCLNQISLWSFLFLFLTSLDPSVLFLGPSMMSAAPPNLAPTKNVIKCVRLVPSY